MPITALITGATSGIGYQTAANLLRDGHDVIISGRDAVRGLAAQKALETLAGRRPKLVVGDLSTRSGIESLAEDALDIAPVLDVLVNNAGSAAPTLQRTVDGLELDFAVNVAAPYGLVRALLPALAAAPAARVVNLSGGSAGTRLPVDDLDARRPFRGLQRYSDTKRATEALTLALARRLVSTGITVNIVYPGQASTSMTQGITPEMLDWWMRPIFPLFRRLVRPDGGVSAAAASRSSTWAATSPDLAGVTGRYFDKTCAPGTLHPTVLDEAAQEAVVARVEEVWGPPGSWSPRTGLDGIDVPPGRLAPAVRTTPHAP